MGISPCLDLVTWLRVMDARPELSGLRWFDDSGRATCFSPYRKLNPLRLLSVVIMGKAAGTAPAEAAPERSGSGETLLG